MSSGVSGMGRAGTPFGGVVTVQGIVGGVAVPVTLGGALTAQVEGRSPETFGVVGNPVWVSGRDAGGIVRSFLMDGEGRTNIVYGTPSARLDSIGISVAALGDNTIIPGLPLQIIRVYKMFIKFAADVDIFLRDGSGGAAYTGTMSFAAKEGYVFDFDGEPWFETAAGNNFVLNLSAAVQSSGRIYFTQS